MARCFMILSFFFAVLAGCRMESNKGNRLRLDNESKIEQQKPGFFIRALSCPKNASLSLQERSLFLPAHEGKHGYNFAEQWSRKLEKKCGFESYKGISLEFHRCKFRMNGSLGTGAHNDHNLIDIRYEGQVEQSFSMSLEDLFQKQQGYIPDSHSLRYLQIECVSSFFKNSPLAKTG